MERAHASAMKAYAMSMVLYNEDLRKVVINALAIEIDAVCYISRFVLVNRFRKYSEQRCKGTSNPFSVCKHLKRSANIIVRFFLAFWFNVGGSSRFF